MIDDYATAMELVRKMKAQLPIPARPTKTFIRAMHDNEMKVRPGQNLPRIVKSLLDRELGNCLGAVHGDGSRQRIKL